MLYALAGLPDFLVYADDTDFVSLSREYLDRLLEVLGPIFKDDFDLIVNVDKAENTRLGHKDMDVNQDEWRNTRKLGSLLGLRYLGAVILTSRQARSSSKKDVAPCSRCGMA